MAGARMDKLVSGEQVASAKLASLRMEVERLETSGGERASEHVPLGHVMADTALRGGLALGALHEVFSGRSDQAGTATGFVLGLVRRATLKRRFVLWIRQDFSALESGDLAMNGFAELGLDPRHLVVVRAPHAEMVLRIAADGLACNALGAVVAEIWGETKAFDMVASRKLTLAAGTSGVTALMLRLGATPQASTAETRWVVRAAHSPPVADWQAWGTPLFDAELVRNRHGQTGRWIMEWTRDEYLFRERATHSQPMAAASADRPLSPPAGPQWRRSA
ncbi:DNA replication/repair protein [Afipia sp. P52-10]|uniref:ImuA family protein n=1 Tax=Afipia sp. P52-10 TaxID=1429916 RepID=UPI0003DF460C|nr:DNA repair protein [Afipia sp. P52-10]ETR76074.1 DNA replication/repair protein [Afipia sp. P52-10]